MGERNETAQRVTEQRARPIGGAEDSICGCVTALEEDGLFGGPPWRRRWDGGVCPRWGPEREACVDWMGVVLLVWSFVVLALLAVILVEVRAIPTRLRAQIQFWEKKAQRDASKELLISEVDTAVAHLKAAVRNILNLQEQTEAIFRAQLLAFQGRDPDLHVTSPTPNVTGRSPLSPAPKDDDKTGGTR